MRLITPLLILCFLFFQSCEMLENNTENPENNQSSDVKPEKPQELTEAKTIDPPKVKPTPPKPVEVEKKPPPPPKKPTPSKPEKAAFTPELLNAVKNWNAIPRSVFPLRAVTINKDVKFNIYSKTGQPIGSSMLPAGREVVAIGHKGNMLAISPSNKGTMRGSIAMDDTDFKDGVAYLFELRKMERIAYAKRKADESENVAIKTKSPTPTKKNTAPKKKTSTPLFEDLPSPGDYGHGKFCICSDCRTKRLAQTGSMK